MLKDLDTQVFQNLRTNFLQPEDNDGSCEKLKKK